MKQLIFLVCGVWCLVANQAQAQRRLPDQQAIEIKSGLTDGYGLSKNRKPAYYLGAALSRYMGNGDQWVYGVEYLEKRNCYKCHEVPISQFTAEVGYYYNFYTDRYKNVWLSAGGSALIGYETANWGKKHFPDGARLLNKDSFAYGAAFTLEAETFVHDRIALLIQVRERILFGSDSGKFHNQIGIGIKYIYK